MRTSGNGCVVATEALEARRLLAVSLVQQSVLDTANTALGSDRSGNLAFVAESIRGLAIFDVSNAAAPISRGVFQTNSACTAVTVKGNLAFVGTATGLQVLDISNLATVHVIGTLPTSNTVNDIQISGNLAFLSTGSSGLTIASIADPRSPQLDSRLTAVVANHVAVKGNLVYVAEGSRGFAVVNVVDPFNPQVVQTQLAGFNVADLTQQNNVLFVATQANGLNTYNILNPSNPVFIGNTVAPNQQPIVAVDAVATTLFVGSKNSVFALDAQNPAALVTLGSFTLASPVINSVGFGESTILVGTNGQGLRVLEARGTEGSISGTGVLQVLGTTQADQISVSRTDSARVTVMVNGILQRFTSAGLTGIDIRARAGDDLVAVSSQLPRATIFGGDGNDTIMAGDGGNAINGGAGNDNIASGTGNDAIFGGDGNDTIYGGPGNDSIDGGAGNDLIFAGQGDDTVIGGSGQNTITGGAGRDLIYANDHERDVVHAKDGEVDTIFADASIDVLDVDPIDVIHLL